MLKVIGKQLGKSLLRNVSESFIDNVIRDKVTPVPGSVVYCELAFAVEHSGIYIGDDQIVHLDGSGEIEVVTPQQFLDHLDGWNNAISIYVSCNDCDHVGSEEVADRARAMIGMKKEYSVATENCHMFTTECLTGVSSVSDNTFISLKKTTRDILNNNTWRVWDV